MPTCGGSRAEFLYNELNRLPRQSWFYMLFNLLFLVLKESLSVHCIPLDLVNWGVFSDFYFFFVRLPVFMQGKKKIVVWNTEILSPFWKPQVIPITRSVSVHVLMATCINGKWARTYANVWKLFPWRIFVPLQCPHKNDLKAGGCSVLRELQIWL